MLFAIPNVVEFYRPQNIHHHPVRNKLSNTQGYRILASLAGHRLELSRAN